MKRKTKPAGALEYLVEQSDTIEKIALKWNTIPSEIQRLNRLATRICFPGQTLYVPDPDYVPPPPPPVASPPISPPSKNQLPDSILSELGASFDLGNHSSSSSSSHHNNTASSTPSSTFNIFKVEIRNFRIFQHFLKPKSVLFL